jgi:hypothetical protein
MQLFDFITQDELDDLPEDPQLAFVEFARIAQRRLSDYHRDLQPHDDSEWEMLNEARYGFMNVVVAAAKRYGVEPFTSLDLPTIANFGSNEYRQFKADVDHYVTQLVVGNAIRGKRDSVLVPTQVKDRIRAHIHALRDAVEKADLTDAKRSVLLDRLEAFEKELEKRRLSLLEVTRIMVTVAAVPGSLWASGELVAKLTHNVFQAVAEAKAAEDEARQVHAPEPMKAITAARKPTPTRARGPTETFTADIDDEIPF